MTEVYIDQPQHEPVTAEIKNLDYLTAVKYYAGKPWILRIEAKWDKLSGQTPLQTKHTPGMAPAHSDNIGPPAATPQKLLKNISGRAQGFTWPQDAPDPNWAIWDMFQKLGFMEYCWHEELSFV